MRIEYSNLKFKFGAQAGKTWLRVASLLVFVLAPNCSQSNCRNCNPSDLEIFRDNLQVSGEVDKAVDRESETNLTYRGTRKGRVGGFPLLSLGKVLNFFPVGGERECKTDGPLTRSGVCLNPYDCHQRGGRASGDCAHGFGVCCSFTATCGGHVSNNLTYILSPDFPAFWEGGDDCSITITKMHQGISQLRLDFVHFNIGQPNRSTGACDGDMFELSSDENSNFKLCGQNHGQHIYYDMDGGPESVWHITVRTRRGGSPKKPVNATADTVKKSNKTSQGIVKNGHNNKKNGTGNNKNVVMKKNESVNKHPVKGNKPNNFGNKKNVLNKVKVTNNKKYIITVKNNGQTLNKNNKINQQNKKNGKNNVTLNKKIFKFNPNGKSDDSINNHKNKPNNKKNNAVNNKNKPYNNKKVPANDKKWREKLNIHKNIPVNGKNRPEWIDKNRKNKINNRQTSKILNKNRKKPIPNKNNNNNQKWNRFGRQLGSGVSRLFQIRVTQLPLAQKAPPGCLQYFTSWSGKFETMNFAENGRHLSDQDYKVCVRRAPRACAVAYEPCDAASFRIGPRADGQKPVGTQYIGPGQYGGAGTGFYGPQGTFVPGLPGGVPEPVNLQPDNDPIENDPVIADESQMEEDEILGSGDGALPAVNLNSASSRQFTRWSPWAQQYAALPPSSVIRQQMPYWGYGNFGHGLFGYGRQRCDDHITAPCDNDEFITGGVYGAGVCDPYHCGSTFCPGTEPGSPCRIESSATPFQVSIHFGPPTPKSNPEENIGACLRYEQVLCS